MSGVVVFNPTGFIQRYPEFAAVTPATLALYFAEACLYLNNTPHSPVWDINARTLFLNMITAHIAKLNGVGANEQGAQDIVGRIESATEGTVSVQGSYYNNPSPTMAFWTQTKYGAAYWQATSGYRSAHYIPRPCYEPMIPGPYPWFGRGW